MLRRTRYTFLVAFAALSAALSACSNGSPTEPSAAPAGAAATPAPAGATISGTVTLTSATGRTAPGTFTARGVSDLTVSVVGTSLSTGVDAAGRFQLTSVPPGDVRLRFAGPGVDATVTVADVQASQTRTITVTVSGGSATMGDDSRGGSDDEFEFTGTLTAMSGSAPGAVLTVAGRTVRTSTATIVRRSGNVVGFDQLQIGATIEVEGSSLADGSVQARRIEIEDRAPAPPAPNPNPAPAPNPPQPPAPGAEAEFTGTLSAMTGTQPGATLTIGGRTVRTNAATVVRRSGNVVPFTTLAVGQTIEVKGTAQSDGSVLATRLTIEDDDEDENEVEFTGVLSAMSGTQPGATLTIGGRTVRTNAATVVRRSGNVVAFSTLAVGQTIEVDGTGQADGSVLATRLTIEDLNGTPGPVEAEVEGTLTSIAGDASAATLIVEGRTVRTTSQTRIDGAHGSSGFSTLAVGQRVRARGTVQPDNAILASRIQNRD